jgi:hypothetical protein
MMSPWFGGYTRHPPLLGFGLGLLTYVLYTMGVHAIRGARPPLVCGSYMIGLKKRLIYARSVRQHCSVGMFSLEHYPGERESSAGFSISFPCVPIFVAFAWVALILGAHSAQARFGLEWENFHEGGAAPTPTPAATSTSQRHSSHRTVFTVHPTSNDRHCHACRTCRTSPAYTTPPAGANSKRKHSHHDLCSFTHSSLIPMIRPRASVCKGTGRLALWEMSGGFPLVFASHRALDPSVC